MHDIDLNLLVALDALLTEGSVVGAARRLGLSSSAMSRSLSRLRHATGDPLLVRAGRGLVPTPRAAELRERVHSLTREARAMLTPRTDELDLALLERTFVVRASEGFVEGFSAPLVAAIIAAAPRVRVRFVAKPNKDAEPLREGRIDLEVGVLGTSAPEMRIQTIFRDRFVGAVREGHPMLAGEITPGLYAACRHVVTSRKEDFTGPVDDALERIGLARRIVAVVPGHPDALRIARDSDLVALVPLSCFGGAKHPPAQSTQGVVSFELPVQTPEIVISAMWHPRFDADPAHRWLRDTLMAVCRVVAPPL